MRAVIVREFGALDSPEVGELSAPTPGPLEIQIAVQAVAVHYVDLLGIGGKYQFLPEPPFGPGKGPAGTVTAVRESGNKARVGGPGPAMAGPGGYPQTAVCGGAN